MKKLKYLLIIIFVTQFLFSQNKKRYEIYLFLNAMEKEMIVDSVKISDTCIKIFKISKAKPIESKYLLSINENNQLIKSIKGNVNDGAYEVSFTYNSKKNKKKYINIIGLKNIISFDDFMNTSFKNFLEILRGAKNIFVIDSTQKKNIGYYIYCI